MNKLYFYLSKILAPFLNLSNILFFLLIFLFFINLKKKIKYKILLNITLITILILSLLPIGKLGLKYLEKDYFKQDKILNISHIFVLAGSEDLQATKKFNQLNLNDNSERLILSVKLAIDNPDSKIFYVGVNGNLIHNSIDETSVAKLFYKNIGFDLNRVYFIGDTRNTIENLQAIKSKNLAVSKNKNVLITSAFHMKRSMMIAREIDLNLVPYAVDFKSVLNFSFLNYYQGFNFAENLASFNIFFREIVGIIAFKIFY